MEINPIPLGNLALAFIPALLMVGVMFAWSLRAGNALYAMARMLGQLLLIGYFLAYIFESKSVWVVLGVIGVMVVVASWISLNNATGNRRLLYLCSLGAILL